MRGRALLLCIVLLAPGALAWNQYRGEADRSATIEPPRGTLDVAATASLLTQGAELRGRGPLATVDGDVVAVSTKQQVGTCQVHRAGAAPVDLEGCTDGRLLGQIPGGDFLVCMTTIAGTGIVAAYDAAGKLSWSVDPRVLVAPGGLTMLEAGWDWSCEGAAIADQIIVPFLATASGADAVRHRIAAIGLDGVVAWVRPVSFSSTPELISEGTAPDFLPLTVAVNTVGIVVSGLMPCGDVPICRASSPDDQRYVAALAWLDRDGATRGVQLPLPRPSTQIDGDPVSMSPLASSHAAGEEVYFAARIGGRALIVDPRFAEVEENLAVSFRESGEAPTFWSPPLWQRERLVIATDRYLEFLARGSYDPLGAWSTREATERIVDLAGDRLGRLYVLTIDVTESTLFPGSEVSRNASVYVINPSGSVAHELPLNATTRIGTDAIHRTTVPPTQQFVWMQAPQFLEVDGGLAVVDALGRVAYLAERDVRPTIHIDNAWPEAGEVITITIAASGDPAHVRVRWGDGYTEDHAWQGPTLELEHFYDESVRHDLIVTVLDADGTTMSASRVVDVGGSPPPQLNFIQRAFAPGNQDTTWGIIGLAVALGGGLYGVLRIRRNRRRLHALLARIRAIREEGQEDPLAALKALEALRRQIRDKAATGAYDQGQLHILETRIAQAARALLLMGVEPFRDRLTPVYEAMLSGFFEDGSMTEHESRLALEALERQRRLSAAERTRLRDMIHVLNP